MYTRNIILAIGYGTVAIFSLWMSLLLRFDFAVPKEYWLGFKVTLLWILPIKLATLLIFGQFRSLLTYFSLSDAKRVILAMGTTTLIALCIWYGSKGSHVVPRGVIMTDFLISVGTLYSLRTLMRIYREGKADSEIAHLRRKKVAIIGAGEAGASLMHEIQSKSGLGMDVICFVDDDPQKKGSAIHGRKIMGNRADLPEIVNSLQITHAIIAMPRASPGVVRETVEILNKTGVQHDILPSVTQLLHRHVTVSHLRHVESEDLLGRDPVRLDDTAIESLIRDKVVLVTGAGGSIGSELCRQIASRGPKKIILLERSEPALFAIEQELVRDWKWIDIEPVAGSICNEARVEGVFEKEKPELVFHAAAHKHVPLMERQPDEAILNNSIGTMVISLAASRHASKKMILVSTDKAVNPTNVMGATKRVAELTVAAVQHDPKNNTILSSVRFGNVLGSSGSVIPTFRKQIEWGGPVTVTHPDVTRYFMSIPEAVGLILQSATQSKGGEVFVLDMGDPIKINDIARQMIELSGFRPDEDIKIEFTGLRPGEKLYEEPIHEGENIILTTHPKVRCLIRNSFNNSIIHELNHISSQLHSMSKDELKKWLNRIVPEYKIS